MSDSSVSRPEAAAASVLRAVWADPSGEIRLPIDPVRIAGALGLSVAVSDLPDDWAGVVTKQAGDDETSIFVNRGDGVRRQRFTIAHEIGHWYLHAERGDVAYDFAEFRDALSAAGTDPDERWANAFAAELLIPEEQVRRLAAEMPHPPTLSVYFAVSPQAMRYRFDNLGVTVGG